MQASLFSRATLRAIFIGGFFFLLIALLPSPVWAGVEEGDSSKTLADSKDMASPARRAAREKGGWDIPSKTKPRVGSGSKATSLSYAESALRENQFEAQLSGGYMPAVGVNSADYSIVPVSLSLNWNLDDVGNSGWRRGNTQFRFSAFYLPILSGPENRFLGFLAGPQYQFVQPGSNFVPFVGAQVGVGFVDSGVNTTNKGQGQDFCFTFSVNAGVRYYITEHCSVAAELMYQHFSNAGLSEPIQKNIGLDLLGPVLSMVYAF